MKLLIIKLLYRLKLLNQSKAFLLASKYFVKYLHNINVEININEIKINKEVG